MARKVIWSYEATEDLDALAEYIAKDSSIVILAFVHGARDLRTLWEKENRG